jgi:hypothetical protein
VCRRRTRSWPVLWLKPRRVLQQLWQLCNSMSCQHEMQGCKAGGACAGEGLAAGRRCG